MRLLKISFTLVGLFLIVFFLMLVNYTGYAVREDTELERIENATQKSKGLISFSFDDGLLSYYTKVYPAMKASGLNGTVYVIANWTENDGKFEGRELMDFPHMREMENQGWEIASHGVKHKRMTNLSDEELDEELRLSKIILEKNGLKITNIAFPYGHFDDRTVNAAGEYYSTVRPLFLGYNEKENIGLLIDKLEEVFAKVPKKWEMNILVVDDSSPDGTGEVVRGKMDQFKNVHLFDISEKNHQASIEKTVGLWYT